TAHDVSDGGLACALAECCIAGGIGAKVTLDRHEADLFGEAPGGVIVAGPRAMVDALDGAIVIGEVGGDALAIDGVLSVPVTELRTAHEDAIPAALAGWRRRQPEVRRTLDARAPAPPPRPRGGGL